MVVLESPWRSFVASRTRARSPGNQRGGAAPRRLPITQDVHIEIDIGQLERFGIEAAPRLELGREFDRDPVARVRARPGPAASLPAGNRMELLQQCGLLVGVHAGERLPHAGGPGLLDELHGRAHRLRYGMSSVSPARTIHESFMNNPGLPSSLKFSSAVASPSPLAPWR